MFPAAFQSVPQLNEFNKSNGWSEIAGYDAGALAHPVDGARGAPVTAMVEVLLIPPLVAVIIADPGAIPVTIPPPLTVATAVLLLDHVVVSPVRIVPTTFVNVAEICCVPPTGSVADDGATETAETVGLLGPVTVIAA